MSTLRPASAKILSHSEGLGTPNADLVRERAQELAVINGRDEYTEMDWQQARKELHGGHPLIERNGEQEMSAWVSERDMVASDCGHHTDRLGMEDDGNIVEELIAEGMDEAVHEQMLMACQEARKDDQDEEPRSE